MSERQVCPHDVRLIYRGKIAGQLITGLRKWGSVLEI